MTAERPSGANYIPSSAHPASRRLFLICGLAVVIAIGAGFLAEVLMALIGFFTNLFFYGRFSLAFMPSRPSP